MIKEEDLLEAIAECQGEKNPNANTCKNLAAFYTILDHMKADKPEQVNVQISEKIEYKSETEFGNAIRGMNTNEILEIMDELMETIQTIHPRLYASVMRKITEY